MHATVFIYVGNNPPLFETLDFARIKGALSLSPFPSRKTINTTFERGKKERHAEGLLSQGPFVFAELCGWEGEENGISAFSILLLLLFPTMQLFSPLTLLLWTHLVSPRPLNNNPFAAVGLLGINVLRANFRLVILYIELSRTHNTDMCP